MKMTIVALFFGTGLLEVLLAGCFLIRSQTLGPRGAPIVWRDNFALQMTAFLGSKGLVIICLSGVVYFGGYDWFVSLSPLTRVFSVLATGLGLCAGAGIFDRWRQRSGDFPSYAEAILGGTGILIALSWLFFPTVVFGL